MRRVTRDELVTRLYVELKVVPKYIAAKFRSKLPSESDAAAKEIAEHLARRLDGDSSMVIEADLIDAHPYGSRPGKFGLDEPDPTKGAV